MLSKRTPFLSGPDIAIAHANAQAAVAEGREIVDLTTHDHWPEPPQALCEAGTDAAGKGTGRYTETIGLHSLRQVLARRVSRQTGLFWKAGEIAIATGAEQALFNAALAILDPGDEVIIPSPYWSSFPAQVSIAGASPIFLPTEDSSYLPDINGFAAAITPRTRAIVISTPNNPTGRVYSQDLLSKIAVLAEECDLWIICDECDRDFFYDQHTCVGILEAVPEVRPRTLLVNSFSKSQAQPGWRIGYLAGPRAVIAAVNALQSHTTSRPNVVAQHATADLLAGDDESFLTNARAFLGLNRAIGLQILSRLRDVPLPPSEGGFHFYLDLRRVLARKAQDDRIIDAADLAAHLLMAAGVAGVPGTAFGDPTGLRLSYGLPTRQLEHGLDALVRCLNEFRDR